MEDDYHRRNKGRFGIRTNKTLKYNSDEAWTRRKENLDTIAIVDKNVDYQTYKNNREIPRISLNARKNWELIENNNNNQRNSLNSSQDDLDVNYGPRIVMLNEYPARNKRSAHKENYKHLVHGSSSDNEENEKENEPESETISGTNRKGFFVKEKRKKGKKGVLRPESKGNRGRSKSVNNKSDSSESDSDSAIDEPEKDERIIIVSVRPKHPDYVSHAAPGGCGCSLCTGIEKNHKVAQRREIVKNIDDL